MDDNMVKYKTDANRNFTTVYLETREEQLCFEPRPIEHYQTLLDQCPQIIKDAFHDVHTHVSQFGETLYQFLQDYDILLFRPKELQEFRDMAQKAIERLNQAYIHFLSYEESVGWEFAEEIRNFSNEVILSIQEAHQAAKTQARRLPRAPTQDQAMEMMTLID